MSKLKNLELDLLRIWENHANSLAGARAYLERLTKNSFSVEIESDKIAKALSDLDYHKGALMGLQKAIKETQKAQYIKRKANQ